MIGVLVGYPVFIGVIPYANSDVRFLLDLIAYADYALVLANHTIDPYEI